MSYQTSYESGCRPFVPDVGRGFWTNSMDFVYAGIGVAFKIDIFSLAWYFTDPAATAFYSIPSHLICMLIYVVPLMVIQSFLGQFSSSGYISAFRLAPIFKGIGYLSALLNFCVLMYYSIFATVPLVYLITSMQPTLPWSCEGFQAWSHLISKVEQHNLCQMKVSNQTVHNYFFGNGSTKIDSFNYTSFVNHDIPSVMYFRTLFNNMDLFGNLHAQFVISWQLALSSIAVWSLIALFYVKCRTIELLGQCMRYTMWTLIALLLICVVRFSFLAGAEDAYADAFSISWNDLINSLTVTPIYKLATFGPGWGLFISLSSYNKFNSNLIKNSWLIALGQMAIFLALNLLSVIIERHFGAITNENYYTDIDSHWILSLSGGSAVASMTFANFWSFIYYFMLFLGAFALMITQLYSILTSIFDEFPTLRERKLQFGLGFISIIALCSLYFASSHGILYFTVITTDAVITETVLNLILILIVCWIYGRENLQRDIEFMLGRKFSTWSINTLRFVAPIVLLFILLMFLIIAFFEHIISTTSTNILAIIFIGIPWIFIPGYMMLYMWQTSGSIKMRFKRCCRPTDWYPTSSDYRQRYEELLDTLDITHQLNEITEEDGFKEN